MECKGLVGFLNLFYCHSTGSKWLGFRSLGFNHYWALWLYQLQPGQNISECLGCHWRCSASFPLFLHSLDNCVAGTACSGPRQSFWQLCTEFNWFQFIQVNKQYFCLVFVCLRNYTKIKISKYIRDKSYHTCPSRSQRKGHLPSSWFILHKPRPLENGNKLKTTNDNLWLWHYTDI